MIFTGYELQLHSEKQDIIHAQKWFYKFYRFLDQGKNELNFPLQNKSYFHER